MHRTLLMGQKSPMKTATGGSYKTLRSIQKVVWQNILVKGLAKQALWYPKCVPWDKNFECKIFLVLSNYEVLLWDFSIYGYKNKVYGQNGPIWDSLAIT